jgi:hypothetical protein
MRLRPLLDETWFESAWAIGDLTIGDLIEHPEAIVAKV